MIRKQIDNFKSRWHAECGYREVLILAFPLIISTGTWSIQQFIDRMFLTWFSNEAIAAAMPAGILNFTLICLFMGTASYVGTFVAQYYGADEKKLIGPILWQGLYVSIIAGIALLILIPYSVDIFTLIGHDKAVMDQEIIYFQILCLGAFPVVGASAIAGLFSGLGRTMIIMWVNVSSMVINIIFNYLLIFGKFGFPEMGIKGAAISSLISAIYNLVVYVIIICFPSYNRDFNILRGWKFNSTLFSRLMKFGLPSGIQFFLDIAGFTIFILLIGRLGITNLAASNIALNISNFSFMPMIGFGIAISILVGQNIGKGNIELAEYSVYSGFHMTFIYTVSYTHLRAHGT